MVEYAREVECSAKKGWARGAGGEQQPRQPWLGRGGRQKHTQTEAFWVHSRPHAVDPKQAAKRSRAREPKWRQLISSASSWLKITSLISLSEITTGLEIHSQ